MPLQLGERIWVESLLSEKEWKECAKKYPNTCGKGSKPEPEFECEFKWRKGIGGTMSPAEIKLINSRLDEIRRLGGLKPHES